MLKVKICGLKEKIDEVVKLAPDYLGFIFYDKSPRFIKDQETRNKIKQLKNAVGVFVNPSFNELKELNLPVIQIHGEHDLKLLERVKTELPNIEVVLAFQVDIDFDFSILGNFLEYTDKFLFDAKGEGYGATGNKFNWDALSNYPYDKPYFIAGGLTLEDVPKLKKMKNLYAADFNSGLEIAPGVKDLNLVEQVIKEIRNV